jgi:hypothetical protein
VAPLALLTKLPQPDAGLSVHETPPLLLSLLTAAVIVIALDPAATVVEVTDGVTETEI